MNSEIENRFFELRADIEKRELSGIGMSYGEIAVIGGLFRERFLAGSFGDVSSADVILNFQHVRQEPLARSNGGGLVLTDSPQALRVHATLPSTRASDDVLELVRTKVLRGLSLEFRATQEKMVSGVREISKAVLTGVGVVDKGAYPSAQVSARYQTIEEPQRRRWY